MSDVVERQVVEMRFDNKQFEAATAETMSTLEKLKQKLNFSGASKGLENVSSAAKNVNLTGLTSAVDTVHARFSALGVMGVTALANITNQAVNTAKRITAAFTIDPIKTGFQEYETQINAVQTILANTQSKGTTLNEVNKALDELNTYADKTIYNFTEMTRNIGTFTAAGVDLKTSVSAIQGIANLAAVSGSTSQQASTAMYQLSQALAAGTVKLMDWNSVVNAGMGGQVFQDALKKTSEQLGTGAEAAIKAEGSFRESLKEGWLTAEVLTETLNKLTTSGAKEYVAEYTGLSAHAIQSALDSAEAQYGEANAIKEASKALAEKSGKNAEEIESTLTMAKTAEEAATKVKTFSQLTDTLKEAAQSGWTQTWEMIVGDFEDAKSLWTEVSDVLGGLINASAEARNALVSGAFESGWKQFLNQGIADEEGYKEAFKGVVEANGASFDKMIEDAGSFEAALKKGLSEGTITSDMLSQSVTNLADKMRGMSEKERDAAGYTFEHLTAIEALEAGLKDGSIAMDEFTEKMMRPSGRELMIESVRNAFNGIMDVVKPVKEAFEEVFPRITSEQLYSILESIRDLTAKFKLTEAQAENLKATFKGLFSVVGIGVDFLKSVASGFARLVGNLKGMTGGFLEVTASIGNWLTGLRKSINEADIFTNTVDKIVTFLEKGINKLKEFIGIVKGDIRSPGFEGFVEILLSLWNILKKVGSKIAEVGSNIGKVISNAFTSGDVKGFIETFNTGVFAAILLNIKKIFGDITEVFDGGFFENIKETLDGVRECLSAYQQQLKAEAIKKIAVAIAILAAALFVIATINPDKLGGAIAAITILFIEIAAFMKVFDTMKGTLRGVAGAMKTTTMLIGVAGAVLILAGALKVVGNLNFEQMSVGLIGVAALVVVVVKAAEYMSRIKGKAMKGALNMVIFAAAIKILASACKDLSVLNWEELAKGLTGVSVLIGAVTGFLVATKNSNGGVGQAVSIVILAGAIKILASACSDFGAMSWDEIVKGLSSIGALLTGLALFTNFTANAGKVVAVGVSLVAVAASMKIFASAMTDISKLSWEGIGKGLSAMAGALLTISVAMRTLPDDMFIKTVALIGVAAAITILSNALVDMSGMSWNEVAKGLTSLAGSMLILALGLRVMRSSIGGSAALLVAAGALAILVPVIKSLGDISLSGIGKSLLTLAGVFTVLGVAILVLKPLIPSMLAFSGAVALFGAGCALAGVGILAASVGITALGASLVVAAASIVEVIMIVVRGLGDIISGVANAIAGSAVSIAKAIVALISAICIVIRESIPEISETVLQMVVGVLEALRDYTPMIVDLLIDIFAGVLNTMSGRLPELIAPALDLLKAFVDAITNQLFNGNFENLITTIGAISGVLLALSVAAKIMSTIPVKGALKGLGSMSVFIGGLVGILTVLGAIAQIPGFAWLVGEGGKLLGGIGTVIGTFLSGIVGSFALLTTGIPFESVMGSIVALSTLLLAMSGIMIIVSKMHISLGSAIKGIVGLTLMAVPMAAFVGVLALMSGVENATANVKTLIGLTAALTALLIPLTLIGASTYLTGGGVLIGILALTAMAIPMLTFIGLLKLMEGLQNATTNVNLLTGLMTTLTGMLVVLAIVGPLAVTGVGALAGLMLLIGGIGALAVSVGAMMDDMPYLEDFLDRGIPVLEKMANAVGSILGNVVSGFVDSVAAVLPGVGTYLSEFMINAKPFIEGLKSVDSGMIEGVGVLAGAIVALTAADLIAGIMSFLKGGTTFADLGLELSRFMINAMPFILGASLLNDKVVTGVKALSEMIMTLTKANIIEGITSWFTGGSSLASFGEQLLPFGEAMVAFSNTVSGIDESAVTAAANAGKILSEMAANLPNSGGVVGFFAGENDLNTFASQLVPFGTALAEFSNEVAGKINEEAITAAVNAGKIMSEFAATLPNSGGVVGFFAGDNDIDTFGLKLVSFGNSLTEFSEKVAGNISEEAILAAANAGKMMSDLATSLPSTGGVISWFTGHDDLATFGTQLSLFGDAIVGFSEKVAGNINEEAVLAAANAGKVMAELAKNLPESGGFMSIFQADDDLSTFGSELVKFGEYIVEYSEEVSTIDSEAMTNAITQCQKVADLARDLTGIDTSTISSLSESLGKLAKDGVSKFVEAFEDAESKVIEAVEGMLKAATKAIDNKVDDFEKAGTKSAKKFAIGIEDNAEKAEKKAKTMAGDAAEAAEDKYDAFYDAGEYMVQGFANGISDKTFTATAKATAMAQAALKAAKDALNINSPSRVTREFGRSYGEGFIAGIDEYAVRAADSGANIAETAKTGLYGAISKLKMALDTDIDAQPTIRPVMDLSEVKTGTEAISSMFNNRPALAFAANVRAASVSMTGRGQNGTNNDVVNELSRLGKKLDNVGNNYYNINGIEYQEGDDVATALTTIVRRAKIERRS